MSDSANDGENEVDDKRCEEDLDEDTERVLFLSVAPFDSDSTSGCTAGLIVDNLDSWSASENDVNKSGKSCTYGKDTCPKLTPQTHADLGACLGLVPFSHVHNLLLLVKHAIDSITTELIELTDVTDNPTLQK